ncbi:MAG: hypothetical protein MUF02_02025 [Acidobacteria bacterium]|jgi:hypothetical protein|nr:hypothetical protein [Acidobacteriota bacterium]
MNKSRVAFLAGMVLIAALALLWLNRPDVPRPSTDGRPGPGATGFQVTGISDRGNLWLDRDEVRPVDIKLLDFLSETRLHSDAQTAWEFLFEGFLFTALPGSAVRFTPQTRELILEKGEFYWERKQAGLKVEASLFKGGNIVTLSAAGRLRLGADALEAWNYSGQLDFDLNGRLFHLGELQYLNSRDGSRVAPAALFPAPPFVSPESETIALTQPNDTIIQFKWKNVQGARRYILKLYPSVLRDNLLLSKVVAGNAITLDIMPFSEHSELHWEVAAFDEDRLIESAPSRMGVIAISSSLLKKGQRPEPPRIEVGSLSVSGEMVLIKGVTDPHALLFIDGAAVELDGEGRFIHTISYRSIGIKEIAFRAVAPSGLEAVLKKQVTIFEE